MKYLAAIGGVGGSRNTAAQNEARSENGKKGGRPKLTAAQRKKRKRICSAKARKVNRRGK